MAEPKEGSEQQRAVTDRNVAAQVAFLKKVVVLLVLAGLATSACLNIYMVRENVVLRRRVNYYMGLSRGVENLHQFCQRLVRDLKQFSDTDETARHLLVKYQRDIDEFNLDAPTRGFPGQ